MTHQRSCSRRRRSLLPGRGWRRRRTRCGRSAGRWRTARPSRHTATGGGRGGSRRRQSLRTRGRRRLPGLFPFAELFLHLPRRRRGRCGCRLSSRGRRRRGLLSLAQLLLELPGRWRCRSGRWRRLLPLLHLPSRRARRRRGFWRFRRPRCRWRNRRSWLRWRRRRRRRRCRGLRGRCRRRGRRGRPRRRRRGWFRRCGCRRWRSGWRGLRRRGLGRFLLGFAVRT